MTSSSTSTTSFPPLTETTTTTWALPPWRRRPHLIVLLSGKRKSGKDFVAEQLRRHFEENTAAAVAVIRLSSPLKKLYAREHDLDFDKLLDSSEYKERYRKDMIVWGENRRRLDPGFFCRSAIEDAYSAATAPSPLPSPPPSSSLTSSSTSSSISSTPSSPSEIWIVSDARRVSDIDFFRRNFRDVLKTVRVITSELTRSDRGWKWTSGVDDAESECGLDDFLEWNFLLENEDDDDQEEDDWGGVSDAIFGTSFGIRSSIERIKELVRRIEALVPLPV